MNGWWILHGAQLAVNFVAFHGSSSVENSAETVKEWTEDHLAQDILAAVDLGAPIWSLDPDRGAIWPTSSQYSELVRTP